MRTGVISDSHDNIYNVREALRALAAEGVDLIIHLGDVISPFVLKIMKEEAPDKQFVIIKGNNDGELEQLIKLSLSYGWEFYGGPTIYEVGGRKLLLFHGYDGVELTERIAASFLGGLDVDAVLFGHTHKPLNLVKGGKLLFNPGELCGYLTGRATYGIIDLNTLRAEIRELVR